MHWNLREILTESIRASGNQLHFYDPHIFDNSGSQIDFARRSRNEGWILWSDSHRRIAVYETAPVAAEAQGLDICDF